MKSGYFCALFLLSALCATSATAWWGPGWGPWNNWPGGPGRDTGNGTAGGTASGNLGFGVRSRGALSDGGFGRAYGMPSYPAAPGIPYAAPPALPPADMLPPSPATVEPIRLPDRP